MADTETEIGPGTDGDGSGPGWIRRHRLALGLGAAVLAAVGAWLAFGVFGVQFLFIDDEVDEAGPVFASGADADSGGEDTPPEPGAADDEGPGAEARPTPTEPPQPAIVTLVEGEFVPRSHPGEGVARVLNDGSEQRFLRFEQFSTDNGPDLNVYLSTAPADADEGAFDDDFVDLGDLKGNIGDQNYEIPPEVDLDRHSTVVVWCVRFGVAFTVAPLA